MAVRSGLTAGVLVGTLVLTAAPAARSVPAPGERTPGEVRVAMRAVSEAGLKDGSILLTSGDTRARARFSLLGVTWDGERAPDVRVRVHTVAGWQPWQELEPLADLGAEGSRRGSEPVWVGPADRVRVRIAGPARGARLVLVAPGRDPERAAAPATRRTVRVPTRAPRPELHTRKDWGAKERWRNGKPRYNNKLKQVHVHHTAGTNDYKRREVRGILRSIYRYHTKALGWSDIGYNFLVDRFGRAWVGRAGGADRLVRGAHTLGFNHASTGIAVLGNFEEVAPSEEAVRTVVHLTAWKLDRAGRNPSGNAWVTSTGSDLFRKGERVKLPVTDGHRDTNATACPGELLYDLIPEIRERAAHRVEKYS